MNATLTQTNNILRLNRDALQPTPNDCMLGTLSLEVDGVPILTLQTIERPWVPTADGPWGTPNKSCIPVGTYQFVPRFNDVKKQHWILSNSHLGIYENEAEVPRGTASPQLHLGRCYVLIHSANWAHQLEGCIAPGTNRHWDGHDWEVMHSIDAMDRLRAHIAGQSGQLVINQLQASGSA